jgi:quercetin dioxygenase-like cupin family protein
MKNSFWLFNTHLTVVVDEQVTGGHYDLIKGSIVQGTETPLHLHKKYSEGFYVLEGEFTAYVPKKKVVLKKGDYFYIPAGIPHVMAATGKGISQGLAMVVPSGFAKLIREVGTPGDFHSPVPEDPSTMEKFMQRSEELGDIILGPPGVRPDGG